MNRHCRGENVQPCNVSPLSSRRPRTIRAAAGLNIMEMLGGRLNANSTTNKKKEKIMGEILALVNSSKGGRGTTTSKDEMKALKDKFDALEELPVEYDAALLNGTWKLLWTTEKEILFIIKDNGLASWCGTTAGEVYQVIDLDNQRLQNCIEFPPEGSFVVDSSLQYAPDKCSFEFQGARLNLPKGKTVTLPPLGKSRFKTLFVNRKHRIALDDRGDYLIVERVGPPSTRFL